MKSGGAARAVARVLLLISATIAAATPGDVATDILNQWHFTGRATIRLGGLTNTSYEVARGTLDLRGHEFVALDTRFPVASNTKVYVAISLYQLQERGLVNLSQSIQDYLGAADFAAFGVPNATRYCPYVEGDDSKACQNITFVQLLNMQACIPGMGNQYFPYPGTLGLVFGRYFNAPLACKPGTAYYYSNAAFMLGAYFVEKFSGQLFSDYLREHVHGPIGQKDTYFDPFNGKYGYDPKRAGEYYEYYDVNTGASLARGACSSEFDMGSASGAGGIVSTQYDEALLYFTLFDFGAQSVGAPLLTKRASLIDLVRPRTVVGPWNASHTQYYAQGLFVVAPTGAFEAVPTLINYEGEIVCSHTANVFVVAKLDAAATRVLQPPYMAQVWSTVPVAFVEASELDLARRSTNRSFDSFFYSWKRRPGLANIAGDILKAFGVSIW